MTILTTKLNNTDRRSKYRHAFWLLIVPASLLLFALVEKYVAVGKYNVMHVSFDSRIPFVPAFIVPYTLWYPALITVGLHHFFRDPDAFRRYIWSFGLTYAISILIFIVFPNGQNMRPNLRGADGFFVETIAYLHKIDTNTNVFPSIHTIGSMLIVFAVLDSRLTRRARYIIPASVFFVLTAVSAVCLKQHSIADVFGGIIVGAIVDLSVYCGIKNAQLKRRIFSAHRAY